MILNKSLDDVINIFNLFSPELENGEVVKINLVFCDELLNIKNLSFITNFSKEFIEETIDKIGNNFFTEEEKIELTIERIKTDFNLFDKQIENIKFEIFPSFF